LRTSTVVKIAIVQILAFGPAPKRAMRRVIAAFTASAVIGSERTRAPTGSAPVGALQLRTF
jgi:hypothetical protein